MSPFLESYTRNGCAIIGDKKSSVNPELRKCNPDIPTFPCMQNYVVALGVHPCSGNMHDNFKFHVLQEMHMKIHLSYHTENYI